MTVQDFESDSRKICPLFFGIWYTLRLRTRKFLLKEGLSRLIPLAAGCSAARNILAVYLASDPFLYNRSVSFDPADAVQRMVVNESDFRGALFPVQDPKIVKKIRTKKRILCGFRFLASRSKVQKGCACKLRLSSPLLRCPQWCFWWRLLFYPLLFLSALPCMIQENLFAKLR